MEESWYEYCKYMARLSCQSMEQVSNSMVRLGMLARQATETNETLFDALKYLESDEPKITGNKRNGTQDRRQAFGSLITKGGY